MFKKILYFLLSWTWALPQTLLGFVLFLLKYQSRHGYYKNAVCTYIKDDLANGLSLGYFLFISETHDVIHKTLNSGKSIYISTYGLSHQQATLEHEYGHFIQSLFLGPFYLFVIGIPSLIWSRIYWKKKLYQRGKKYSDFFTEKWADSYHN